MKRYKSCLECEYFKTNYCENDGNDCPTVNFSGGVCCESCELCFREQSDNVLFCALDFQLFDCPNGIANPVPDEILKPYRKTKGYLS